LCVVPLLIELKETMQSLHWPLVAFYIIRIGQETKKIYKWLVVDLCVLLGLSSQGGN
jgi:hypothetical protein